MLNLLHRLMKTSGNHSRRQWQRHRCCQYPMRTHISWHNVQFLQLCGNSFYTLIGGTIVQNPAKHSTETIIICWKLPNVWVITFMRRVSKSLVRHSTGFIILLWFINERFKVFIHGRWTCLEEIAAWRLFNSLKATLLLQWHHKNTPEKVSLHCTQCNSPFFIGKWTVQYEMRKFHKKCLSSNQLCKLQPTPYCGLLNRAWQ